MIGLIKIRTLSVITISVVLLLFSGCGVLQRSGGPVNKTNIEIVKYHLPSVSLLYKMYFIVYESKELTKSWAYVYRSDDAIDKVRLKSIHSEVYPKLKASLDSLKGKWTLKEHIEFKKICKDIELLFEKEQSVMDQLNSYEAYEDVMIVFQVDSQFERGSDSITSFTEDILKRLNALIAKREEKLRGIIEMDEGQTN